MNKQICRLSGWLKAAFETPVSNLTEISQLYFPRLLENFTMVFVALVNLGVVSTLGSDIVVGVGMVDPIGLVMQYLYIAFGLTTTVLVSQNLGAERPEAAAKSFVQIMKIIGLTGAGVSVVLFLLRRPILHLLYPTAEAAAFECAQHYLGGVLATGPLYAFASMTNGMLRAFNRAREALYITLMVNLSIIIANAVFIYALDWDYRCMSYSITISRLLPLMIIYRYTISKKHRVMDFCWRENLRRDPVTAKKVFQIGVPFALENLFFQSGRLIVQMIAMRLGSLAASVNTINMTLMNFIQCTGVSMADTSINVLGRSMGRGDVASARKYIHALHVSASALNALMLLATLCAFKPIMRMLNAGEEAVPLILINLLIIGAANVFFWPRGFLIANCLKAAGDIRFTTGVAAITMWTIRVLFSYVFSIPMGMGVAGIWTAMAVEWVVRGVIFTIRYHGSRGYEHRLI